MNLTGSFGIKLEPAESYGVRQNRTESGGMGRNQTGRDVLESSGIGWNQTGSDDVRRGLEEPIGIRRNQEESCGITCILTRTNSLEWDQTEPDELD